MVIGPTMALTVTAAGTAVLVTHGNSLRIEMIEERMAIERTERALVQEQIKRLIIDSEDRILQALRNSKDH
jgi:hypothetical protein